MTTMESTSTAPSVLERVLDLAARRFGDRAEGRLTADTDMFEALAIDSMQAMSLLTALEEAFGVEIPDYEMQDVRTFGELADVLAQRL